MNFKRKAKCSFPWQQVIVDVLGNVHPCCHWSGNESCGNINEQPLDEIWNGAVFQNLREGMAEGDLKKAGCEGCMVMQQELWQDFYCNEEAVNISALYSDNIQKNYEEYLEGKKVLDTPPTRISYSSRAACNLECYYCYQNNHKNAVIKYDVWQQQIEPILATASEIIWGGGEPLIQKEFHKFLDNIEKYIHIKFSTTTNGHPIKEEYLKRLELLPAVNIHLSIDAATPETYRTHRIGGELNDLIDILRLLVRYRDKHIGKWKVSWGFLAMKTTIHEMAEAIDMARELTIPISLGPIESYPIEERLDFYNDYESETVDFHHHFSMAYEAIARHKKTMIDMADKDVRFSSEVSDASMNVEYIEKVVREAKDEKFELSKTASIDGEIMYLPDQMIGDLRISFYSTNSASNSESLVAFCTPGASTSFELRLPPGQYDIAIEKKWSYGYGDHFHLVRKVRIFEGPNKLDVWFPHISVMSAQSESAVSFSGSYSEEHEENTSSNLISSSKTGQEYRILECKNLASGEVVSAQMSMKGSFETKIPNGYYEINFFRVRYNTRRNKFEVDLELFLPAIDLTKERILHVSSKSDGTYFYDGDFHRIPSDSLLVNDIDNVLKDSLLESCDKPGKGRSVYSGAINVEGLDQVILRLTKLSDTSISEELVVTKADSFEVSLDPDLYQHEILSDCKDKRVLHFLGAVDLKRDKYMSVEISSDGSSYFYDRKGDALSSTEIYVDVVFEDKGVVTEECSKVLFVGNIANNSYNNVKFLRVRGVEADVLVYDYLHIMGQPEWEDAFIDGPALDENRPDWNSVDLGGFKRPQWFKSVVSSHYFQHERDDSKSSTYLSVAKMVAYAGNRSKLLRLIPRYWDFYNYLMEVHCKKVSQSKVKAIVSDYNSLVYKKSNPHALTEEEVLKFYNMSHTHNNMYGDASLLVLCDYNPVWALFQDRPYIAFEHGTLRDMPFSSDTIGKLLALAYIKAEKVVITNCDNIEAARKLGLDNYVFIPHPVDTYKFKPQGETDSDDLRRKFAADFLIFAPARHNWVFEKEKGLSVYKGNDKMVKAMHFLKERGVNAKLIFCDWGQEQSETRQLIENEGLTDFVEWIEPLSKVSLAQYFNSVDVVLDQFSIGTFGTTCVEAMACSKPVLIYMRDEIHSWAFDELPPVLNVNCEQSIGEELLKLYEDIDYRETVGRDSLSWVEQYHSAEVVSDKWESLLASTL